MPRSRNVFIAPMLPTLVEKAPDGTEWLHEIKYDGYRTQLAIIGKTVNLFTDNCHDLAEQYAPFAKAARLLKCKVPCFRLERAAARRKGSKKHGALMRSVEDGLLNHG